MPDVVAATTLPRPERYLRTTNVCDRFGGIAPETLWRWVTAGWFPKPIRLHPKSRINVWPESEINALIASGQRPGGYRPSAAIAERARRMANRKAGKTAKYGFTRRAP
jgi:predicted DNA-binding transcriptional regulator AlpA